MLLTMVMLRFTLLVEYNSESVTDTDTTPIKSIDDDEMDHILYLFHLEHDDYLLDDELHMLQA